MLGVGRGNFSLVMACLIGLKPGCLCPLFVPLPPNYWLSTLKYFICYLLRVKMAAVPVGGAVVREVKRGFTQDQKGRSAGKV